MRRILLLASVPLAALLCGVGCSRSAETDAAAEPADVQGGAAPAVARAGDGEVAVSAEDAARLGEGFVVWESRRGGAWRIWRRDLSGTGLARLSPDENGHDHCCAHVSPDGTRVAYLSLPHGAHGYGADDEGGALHLVRTDGSEDRVLEPRARTYGWGHRAAVWHDARHLVFIDDTGETVRLDLESGTREVLAAQGDQGRGWLIGASLQAASSGRPSFSLYDRERRSVIDRGPLGGCEPYFTADGRWGYWIAGAGGPLDRLDLATRATATVLAKNDPRLPARQGYLYFPMVSPDGHLLAVGASPGEHDHQTADYDIFVMALDPETLEVVGNAVQLTDETGPDRYPSPFATPLPLGRIQGEAPLHVDLAPSPGTGVGAELVSPRGEQASCSPTPVAARRWRVELGLW